MEQAGVSATHIIWHDPATGAEVWRGPLGDVDHTVAQAQASWPEWAARPLSSRIELVRRFGNEIRNDGDTLARLISLDTGKPLWEAHGEVEAVVARVELAVRAYAERCAQRKHDNGLAGTLAVRHKPHGVMAVITPFSQPAQVPASHIIPALIGGNVVVFKPSEKATATGEMLVACGQRAGLPTGVLQLLVGGPAHGQQLVTHDGVHGVLFSGSAQVGMAIARKLAPRPDKLFSMEAGGNNPLVVWDTPLIADAAVLIVQSAFGGAGQRCTSARRLIVKSALYDPVITEVKRLADRIICGAPFDEPVPYMGPVIDEEAADGLTQSFIYLLSNGGRAIKHMQRGHDTLPFVSPAIIDITQVADRPDVELFGPLLQVIRVDDFDAAIAEANATRFGRCAGLIGGNPQEYNRFWANIRAGQIHWNRPTTSELPAAPVGGLGMSGNHRPTGYYAADSCVYPVSSAEMEQPRATLGTGFQAEG